MQIMPSTAQAVAGGRAEQLQDPAVNLAIGQQYLLALAQDDAIDGDLIRMLASYGQGQGGLRKWVDTVRDQGDPLMFVEAIPDTFTRALGPERAGVFLALCRATAHAGLEPGCAGGRTLPAAGSR